MASTNFYENNLAGFLFYLCHKKQHLKCTEGRSEALGHRPTSTLNVRIRTTRKHLFGKHADD